jgi:hypothetical protein
VVNYDQNLSKVTKKDLSLNYTMKHGVDQNSKNSIDDQNKVFII